MDEKPAEHSAEVLMWAIVTEDTCTCQFDISRIEPRFAVLQNAIGLTCQCRGTIYISVDRVVNCFDCSFPDGIKAGAESKTRYLRT
jgi:hypothetical protein